MTTPPTPAGRHPEPDDSESTGRAAHPAEPERFELPTFETFETPPFESISSGSFETPPAPPPSPEVIGEPPAPAAPEPPSVLEPTEPPAFTNPPPVDQATHAAYGQSNQQPQVSWHDPVESPAPAVPNAPTSPGAGRARLLWLGTAALLLLILAVVLYLVLT
ncbi:hypothetical protein MARA_28800 [Mycolicibacterium arabiense]|uniref:Uncharacterized protein n=1 Tax=Mycolicibacterium arabiense TaxID=1286181 RepID=A0A7I7RXQ6_9MYCO|nr:hypothetical protein [Mycolicibacterium arabiense]MCV7374166.1 hypothetical protein [Mycolicibacterium arabiense]BBY49412.1 hypothetical protein MARA_28800 [Mycolicibacterium arabiense]